MLVREIRIQSLTIIINSRWSNEVVDMDIFITKLPRVAGNPHCFEMICLWRGAYVYVLQSRLSHIWPVSDMHAPVG